MKLKQGALGGSRDGEADAVRKLGKCSRGGLEYPSGVVGTFAPAPEVGECDEGRDDDSPGERDDDHSEGNEATRAGRLIHAALAQVAVVEQVVHSATLRDQIEAHVHENECFGQVGDGAQREFGRRSRCWRERVHVVVAHERGAHKETKDARAPHGLGCRICAISEEQEQRKLKG